MNDQPDDRRQSKDSTPVNFETERTQARKVVQGFTQAVIQWMPLGGSSFALISFLLQREWIQSLLMFPVMAVTVVWAAYSEAVLTRLREISQEQGRKDVDSFVGWLSAVNQAIHWQLAGTEDKYLRCQGSACREYRTEGHHREPFVPLLSEVFVPLELSSAFVKGFGGEELPLFAGFRDEDAELMRAAEQDELRIWDLLARFKQYPAFSRMAVLAWGGYGKTTLMRHITYNYCKNRYRRYKVPKFLPVLLYLRKWQEAIATEQNLDLPLLIEQYHLPSLPEGANVELPPKWAENQLSKGKLLVMFDGFDEVKPEWRESVSMWLDQQMRDYQKSVFVLTSRPGGYKDYVAANTPSSKLFVKPFNADQRQRFVRQWYLTQERYARAGRDTPEVAQIVESSTANLLQQLKERPELEILAKNPLLLNMIANLHRSYAGQQLPQRRSELYQDICTLQLRDRPRERGINMLVPFPESQQVLQKVAFTLVGQNQTSIRWQELETWISNHLHSLDFSHIAAADFLNKIVEVSELIVKRDEDYEFAHLSFQGYLAAVEIKEQKQENLLLENWQASWWKETILLYCAQVNPSNLIGAFKNLGTQEAVNLAYDCLKESPRKVDPELEAELQQLESGVQNLRYQKLQEYLQNRQWKEADKETYRLMIQTLGKEEGQWLDSEDLENFPCEELRTINQLWLSNSDQKFGFSVQKEIYESLGGTREYNENVFHRFGDRVGWKKDQGGWVSYSNLFDMTLENAMRGHLPTPPNYKQMFRFLVLGRRVVIRGREQRRLLSRAKTCNL
ncbi:MAG: GUN4 domain-containing protein [Xenococcus sp. MO_188.B8]|nr:GUN4 domain-containing protein [Xenococcus sp. MO_188.B8]